jgi:peptide/nickel transport system permease protein
VLTEQVFTIPGFGKLIVDAVFNRDYGVVQGVVLCTAIGFILMNLLADVLYVLVNPAPEERLMAQVALDPTCLPPLRGRDPLPKRRSVAREAAAQPLGADRRHDRADLRADGAARPLLPLADPLKSNFLAIRKPPSELYWFGTDELGRDQVSRLFYGAQTSLLAGIVSVLIALAIGIPFGLLAGWYGGWIDIAISRVTEAMLACPFLILAIAFAAILGPSLTNAMIAIGLSAVPIFIRLVRGQVMSVKAEDFVEGARAVGARDLRIMLDPCAAQHDVAHRGAIDIVHGAGDHPGSLALLPRPRPAAALAVLGPDAQRRQELHGAGALDVGRAGRGIFLAVLGFNLLGDGLRDALDPKEN